MVLTLKQLNLVIGRERPALQLVDVRRSTGNYISGLYFRRNIPFLDAYASLVFIMSVTQSLTHWLTNESASRPLQTRQNLQTMIGKMIKVSS